MRYLDAVALAKLKNLRFELLRRRAEGLQGGRHRSVQHALSLEFAQHRQYAPGDELRYLDWKVYARKDRYFVKQSLEEQSLRAYLLVDASGSMAFRDGGRPSKYDHACGVAAGLAYLILTGGDAAGLVTFDVKAGTFLPPRQQLAHLELIDRALARTSPAGETDLGAVLRPIAGLIPRRSLIILISDLLGDGDRILQTVKAFRARKHEVLVIQVLDPTERDLELEGPVRFEGLEDGGALLCEAGLIRRAYREEFDRQLRRYQSGFHQSQIPYAAVYTDVPPDQSLARFLSVLDRR